MFGICAAQTASVFRWLGRVPVGRFVWARSKDVQEALAKAVTSY